MMSVKISFLGARRLSLTWRLLVVASLLLCSARPQAQQSKETQKNPDEEVVTVRSHLVNVDVMVKD